MRSFDEFASSSSYSQWLKGVLYYHNWSTCRKRVDSSAIPSNLPVRVGMPAQHDLKEASHVLVRDRQLPANCEAKVIVLVAKANYYYVLYQGHSQCQLRLVKN